MSRKDSSFSEEKEAKRLQFLRLRNDPGHGLDRGPSRRNKSFLLLFFKKEESCLL
jgi:hypothetical protein